MRDGRDHVYQEDRKGVVQCGCSDGYIHEPYQPYGTFICRYIIKQNRSTEGCSKLKRSVDMTSSGKNGLNIRTNASPKWE